MSTTPFEVCVVGAGPRGLSAVERILANERASGRTRALTVHVVDPSAPGAGTVWRSDQPRHLLMNTVASQITVYTDDSANIEGPIDPGPSLFQWARSIVTEPPGNHDHATLAEATRITENTYPTRAFYGSYLHASFLRTVTRAPAHVTVKVHRSQAVAIADTHGIPGGPQGVRLADGTRLDHLDAIVLAQGHVPARLTPREARTASLARIHHLTYVTPANPADQDLSAIDPGSTVLLRGLGLNFFDHMALFSAGRGGKFRRTGGTLVYEPSGREPRLYAFSRRGVPYHSRGNNEKGAYGRYFPRLLTATYINDLRERTRAEGGISFGTHLWPLIQREVESVYYGALLAATGRAADKDEFTTSYLALPATDLEALLDAHNIPREDRWSWETLAKPTAGRTFADREDFQRWLITYLKNDVKAAKQGNVNGPLKAALDVLRDLRNEIRLAVDHGGLEGNSHRDDLEGWYTPLNAFLSIGPPASRIEEMIALIEAGVLTILGPGTQVRINTAIAAFTATSALVPGPQVRARALIEARLPEPDLRRTEDPLLRHLLDTDQCLPYRIKGTHGTEYHTGGLSVTERPYRLIDGKGNAHPRRFAYGVPTESVHWVTAAGIRPGVDSVTLGDSDAIARALLSLPPVAQVPEALRPAELPTEELVGVIV